MIFVALGTQKFPLDRLLIEVDEILEKKTVTDEVFAQIGNSNYKPRNYKYADFLTKDEFEGKIAECSLLITHSGVSTIMTGISHGKPTIVYPRLAKYGEHVDDHQFEIAQSFSELNYVLLCDENSNLSKLIEDAQTHEFSTYKSQKKEMINTIKMYLESI